MLVAVVLLSMLAGIRAAELGSMCLPVKEEPSMFTFDFMASSDDTAGIKFNSYIQFLNDKTYLPLKIQSLEHIGILGSHRTSTLVIVADCAKIEIDLTVTENGTEYQGHSEEVRVTYLDKTYKLTDQFVQFQKYYSGASNQAGYQCGWNSLNLDGRWWPTMRIGFRFVSFIVESKDVTEKYNKRIKNEVGYQCAF